MTDIIDTVLNVGVFIFVGLMLWLYFKDTPGAPSQEFRAGTPEERARPAKERTPKTPVGAGSARE